MDSNLNHSYITAYSKEFADKVAEAHFAQQNTISGPEILRLCPVKQVNLFVIKVLLAKWKEETRKLKSPYFDFEEKSVKRALKEFMNLLSQNISIEKEHFMPLLQRAVFEAILLAMSPYDYYCKEINNPNKTRVSLKGLRESLKYIKINHHVMEALIDRFEGDGFKEVFNDQAFSMLNEVFADMSATPEDIDTYVQQFTEILPLNPNTVYGQRAVLTEKEVNPPEDEDDALDFSTSYEEVEEIEQTAQPSTEIKFEQPDLHYENGANEDQNAQLNLNDKFAKPSQTLNDKLVQQSRPTLADIHQNQKIASIKSHITLNQKFMFINELFNGDASSFDKMVDFLDTCGSKSHALNYIRDNYPQWDIDNESTLEFMEVIHKKYQ